MENGQATSFSKNNIFSKDNEFFQHIKSLDYEKVNEFISNHIVQLDKIKDTNGLTPLHYSCIIGDIELTKILITNGEKINTIDPNGFNAFHFAADNNHDEIIEYLSTYDDTNEIKKKSFDTKLLLSSSIPIYITGRTALHWASEKGNLESIKKLIKLNLDPFEKDNDGNSSIDLSNIHNRVDCVEYYIKLYDLKDFKWLNNDERQQKKQECYKLCQERMKLKKLNQIDLIPYTPKNNEIFKFSNVH